MLYYVKNGVICINSETNMNTVVISDYINRRESEIYHINNIMYKSCIQILYINRLFIFNLEVLLIIIE